MNGAWVVELAALVAVLGWLVGQVVGLRRQNRRLLGAVVRVTTIVMRVHKLSVGDLEKLMGCVDSTDSTRLVDELARRRSGWHEA